MNENKRHNEMQKNTNCINGFRFQKFSNQTKEVQDLIFEVLISYGLKPDTENTDNDLLDINKCYFENNGWFEVLCDENNTIVGTWGLRKVSQDTVELRKMYLSKSCRGLGLGKKMLELALEKAHQLGYKVVELETASVLKEAISLYEKYGFRKFVRKELSPRCDQTHRLILN